MPLDYKKEYRKFYLPPKTPGIITVPSMNFLAVHGSGDPNEECGAYKHAVEMLYAVAFTIKMSKRSSKLQGFYDGWMKNPRSVMLSCNDGFRPVSFLVEALDEDAGQ